MRRSQNKRTAPTATSYATPPRASSQAVQWRSYWDADSGIATLSCASHEYRVFSRPPDTQSGLLCIEGRATGADWHVLLGAAGFSGRDGDGALLSPGVSAWKLEHAILRGHTRGTEVRLQWTGKIDGRSVQRDAALRGLGATLLLEVSATEGSASGFDPGTLGPLDGRTVHISGLPFPLLALPDGSFAAVYGDRYLSGSAAFEGDAAVYRPGVGGTTNPISESFYVTLSDDPLQPLPLLERPGGDEAGGVDPGRVVIEMTASRSFSEDAGVIRSLAARGLDSIVLLYRDWQAFGSTRRAPAHYPPHPDKGGAAGLQELIGVAHTAGWAVALEQGYSLVTRDSPYRTDDLTVTDADGSPRPNALGGLAMRPSAMRDVARLEASDIQRNLQPDATLLLGHFGLEPDQGLGQVSRDPSIGCGSAAEVIRETQRLVDALRDWIGGPVLASEGEIRGRSSLLTGHLVDGLLRTLDPAVPCIVEPEWATRAHGCTSIGAAIQPGRTRGPAPGVDSVRSAKVALGMCGYLRLEGALDAEQLREYFLMRAVGRATRDADLQRVEYGLGGEWMPLSEALRRPIDLTQCHLHLSLSNGCEIWVNRGAREVLRVELGGETYEIPTDGFLAAKPTTSDLIGSFVHNGGRYDIARVEDELFVDARRSSSPSAFGVSTDTAILVRPGVTDGHRDLILYGGKTATLDGLEYRLSDPGDLRVSYLSGSEVEIELLSTAVPRPIHLALTAPGSNWESQGIGGLRIAEWHEGEWVASKSTLQPTRVGPQIGRLRPGVRLRLWEVQ